MAAKYISICLLSFIAVSSAQLQSVNGKIKITTVTTSGCGDTVAFISQQLAPAYNVYREYLELDFVPWGRTVRSPDNTLTCQFGIQDCWANRLHRCVLEKLKSTRAAQDAQMHYMLCEFSSPFPAFLQGSYLCAQAVGLSLIDVDYCMSSSEGDELATIAESSAQQPMQVINFVPSIVFNDQIDTALHTQARTNLELMICRALAEDPATDITNC